MTNKERKELTRLRQKDWRERTEEEHSRVLLLSRKARPFNSMPRQEKKR